MRAAHSTRSEGRWLQPSQVFGTSLFGEGLPGTHEQALAAAGTYGKADWVEK